MPKKIYPMVKERCVRMVLDHLQEYPTVTLTAAAEAVAKREGVGKESVRRWVIQAQIDGGQRQGPTSEELAEIKELKAKVRRLEEDNEILRRASIFFAGELCATRRGVHRRSECQRHVRILRVPVGHGPGRPSADRSSGRGACAAREQCADQRLGLGP